MEEPRRLSLDSRVFNQWQITKIETTDAGFTLAGDETEAAITNIWIPHPEFPKGISVNVVSNESTPCLIALDVIREYGLVIDDNFDRVCNHIMKRHFPCASLPTEHLALEMLRSNSEKGDSNSRRVMPSRLGAEPNNTGAQEERNALD